MNVRKTIDLYKGFEGETGFFFMAKSKDGVIHTLIKAWGGYVENIVYENPHVENDGWHGLTKLFHEDELNNIDHSLDNYLLIDDKQDFLNDLVWYKNSNYSKYDNETKHLIDELIELCKKTIESNLDLLVACDED